MTKANPGEMVCNADRAEWAQQAIETFQASTGTDAEDAVADLICDLLHWAASKGQDPLRQARRGIHHFVSETLPDCGWELPTGPFVDIFTDPEPEPWNPEGGQG